MVKDILLWFFSQSDVLYILFVPCMAIAFLVGIFSLVRGLTRWT